MSFTSQFLAYPLLAVGLAASPFATAVVAFTTVTSGGYTASSLGAGMFEELSPGYNSPIAGAVRVLGSDDDSATGPIGMGFNFTFFNQTYNQVFITSNGLLTFGATTTNNKNQGLGTLLDPTITPSKPLPNMPFIAAAWNDWDTSATGTDGVYYKTFGTTGSKSFAVEWRETVAYASGNSGKVSFEAVLFEGSNAIEFRYKQMNTGGSEAFGALATSGIRDANGNVNGRFLEWSNNQAVLTNGASVLITPVPEPETWAMLLSGLALIGAIAKRRQSRTVRV